MLQKMVLTNFLSFRERTEFDFTPSKYAILSATNVSNSNQLKGAMFIGPNASGKTNALKGLTFLIQLIGGNIGSISPYRCIFGKRSEFEVEYTFLICGETVSYTVKYCTKKRELEEKLVVAGQQVLSRQGNTGKMKYRGAEIVDEHLDSQTSFLRTASFNTGRFPQDPLLHELMEFLLNSAYIYGYQHPAMLGATAIKFAEETGVEKLNAYLSEMNYNFSLEYSSHSEGMGIKVRVGTGADGQEQKMLFLKRKDYPVPVGIYQESNGNQTFVGMLPELIRVIEKPSMLVIDEFGNSLHNMLAEKIVRFFMEKAEQSQLFITSHCTNLISNSVLRPDQINLVSFEKTDTDKNLWSSTVTRLTKFKPREAQNLEKMYLGGMFEGLPDYEKVQN